MTEFVRGCYYFLTEVAVPRHSYDGWYVVLTEGGTVWREVEVVWLIIKELILNLHQSSKYLHYFFGINFIQEI